MSDREKCIKILNNMRAKGMDICEDETVDMWTDDDIEYFLANYKEFYL